MSDRQVINGMVYKIRTGTSWRDLPERYRPMKVVYTHFRRHASDRRWGDADAEAVPGASQLRTMGFSGTPSQL